MKAEDKYEDVLHDMELAVATMYRTRLRMSDYDVMRTYEALVDYYSAERIGRRPRNFMLSALECQLFEDIKGMCEPWLGRAEPPGRPAFAATSPLRPVTVEIIIRCLKRLLKSAQRWNKSGGPQGYLGFMSEYV